MKNLEELNKILHKLRTYTRYTSTDEVNKDIDRAIEIIEEQDGGES